jgi:hypothetical protein
MHTRHKSAIAILRHSTLVTALEPAPAMHAHDAHRHCAYDAATIPHIFPGPTRTARTFRLAPRSPLPSHHKHARTDKHDTASPSHHNTTPASWRVPPNTAQTYKPHTPHRIQYSHGAYKHTSPACPLDIPHSRNHCALRKHHCTHTAARTSHTAHSSNLNHPHAAHRKSHPVSHAASAPHSRQSCHAAQRRRDTAEELVVMQEQLPARHTNSHHVTPWHPTPPPIPASRPQRVAAHRIAQSNQVK